MVCALVFSLPAQIKKIVPSVAATSGNSSSPYFSGYGGGRVQQIVDGSTLCLTNALIREIHLRADGTAALAARQFTRVILSVGAAASAPGAMSTTFANNRKGAQTVVLDGAYSLPPQTSARPFNIVFKFKTPYLYVRSAGDLLLEWEVPQAPAKANYFFDAQTLTPSSGGTVTPFGTNGKFKSAENYAVSSDASTLQPGGKATFAMKGLNSAYPTVSFWGFSNAMYGTIPLPFDLTALQAPGNFLYVSIDLAFPVALTAQGSTFGGSVALPIPANDALAGLSIHAQALYLDAASNARGWVTSQGLTMAIGRRSGVDAQHLGHYDSTSATGFLSRTPNALVVEFDGVYR